MIRRPPRSTQSRSSAASDVYKRQAVAGSPLSVVLGEHAGSRGERTDQSNTEAVVVVAFANGAAVGVLGGRRGPHQTAARSGRSTSARLFRVGSRGPPEPGLPRGGVALAAWHNLVGEETGEHTNSSDGQRHPARPVPPTPSRASPRRRETCRHSRPGRATDRRPARLQ